MSQTYAAGGVIRPRRMILLSDHQLPHYGAGNKTAVIQVNVSTLGFSNIVVRWDQQCSKTASKNAIGSNIVWTAPSLTWTSFDDFGRFKIPHFHK